jgi:hypothetical protein
MTACQLAIKVGRAHPEVARELEAEVGGTGFDISLFRLRRPAAH